MPLSFARVVELWGDSSEFRAFFTATLRSTDFSAYFWECRPVTAGTVDRPFEFVIVPSDSLSRFAADPRPFREHFEAADAEAEIITFPNLGGDAQLIVPLPTAPVSMYSHLASFLDGAEASQCDALWRVLGVEVAAHVGERPIWLSTAGLGVAWLHLRIDSTPKYYRHGPYRRGG